MLNIFKLTGNNIRKFTSIQLANLFETSTKLMAAKKETITNGSAETATDTVDNMDGIVKFLELVGNLKHLKRTGWILKNVDDCETISGHMYRMSIMTLLLDGKNGLDRIKCMELALVHDLAECIVGDITPYCGVSKEDKKEREMNAMKDIVKLIEPRGERLMELFEEYEEGETPEAKFVKDLDRLDLIMQAFEYEKRDNCPSYHQEFFDNIDGKINHPFVVKIFNEIKAQRAPTLKANHDTDDQLENVEKQATKQVSSSSS